VLATKLGLPRQRAGTVPRSRLSDRLAEATARELTLVCAPAGFGKTTLIADWARMARRPVAWLSLDEGDNDVVRFWRYVAAALEQLHGGIERQVTPPAGRVTAAPPRRGDGHAGHRADGPARGGRAGGRRLPPDRRPGGPPQPDPAAGAAAGPAAGRAGQPGRATAAAWPAADPGAAGRAARGGPGVRGRRGGGAAAGGRRHRPRRRGRRRPDPPHRGMGGGPTAGRPVAAEPPPTRTGSWRPSPAATGTSWTT
jgi:hypothetical protein